LDSKRKIFTRLIFQLKGNISFLILFSLFCSPAKQSPLPSYFIWDQTPPGKISNAFLEQLNFENFQLIDNCLQTKAPFATLIFWAEKDKRQKVTIEYLLTPKPVRLNINDDQFSRTILNPTNIPARSVLNCRLKRGANFINFDNQQQSNIKIISISSGSEKKYLNQLKKDQGIKFFSKDQQLTLELSGKGLLKISLFKFVESGLNAETKEVKFSLLNGKQRLKLQTAQPSLISLQVKEGQLKLNTFQATMIDKKRELSSNNFFFPENIFIILIDACQAKHLSAYGYQRNTSPNIDQLSKDSILFTRAFANASFTRSSVASIFSGLVPDNHGVRILNDGLANSILTLPEFLKTKGFRTAIFSAAAAVSKEFGFFQGVDHYQPAFGQWKEFNQRKKIPHLVKQWLQPGKNNFVYIHFLEPHLPIIPPPPFLNMFGAPRDPRRRLISQISELQKQGYNFSPEDVAEIVNDYDSTIAYVDSEVGLILKYIKQLGLYENSLIIFTSDHGEALYEHRTFGHGHNVYPEAIHVPLIIKFPLKMKIQPGKISKAVQLHSLLATIADIFGEKINSDGQSLLKLITHPDESDNFIVARSFTRQAIFNIGFRDWFLIFHQNDNSKNELYYFSHSKNLIQTKSDFTDFLSSYFFFWKYSTQQRKLYLSPSIDLQSLPAEQLENLRSLGYIN